MSPVPHSSLPDPFSLSNKRGPTSWPNSPVKRNASLFSQSPPQASESFTNKVLPFHVPFEANERKHKSLMKRKQLSALPPPPPPPPIALTAATAAGLETAGEGAISRALLSGNLPGFLSDTRRPDSPMPPVSSSTGRTLRSSPLALSMANEHAAAFMPYNMPPSSSSRFRTRSSQSADEMFNTSSIPEGRQRHIECPRAHDAYFKPDHLLNMALLRLNLEHRLSLINESLVPSLSLFPATRSRIPSFKSSEVRPRVSHFFAYPMELLDSPCTTQLHQHRPVISDLSTSTFYHHSSKIRNALSR
jgi:hypothetical protein